MFTRPIRHLCLTRKLQSLSQRLSTHKTINRSYATFGEDYGRVLIFKEKKPLFTTSHVVRFASQEANPIEQKEKNARPNLNNIMGKLESAYQWNGFIGIEQLQPLIDIIKENPDINLTQEQGLFLLNLCGCEMPSLRPEDRLLNFQQIWQFLHQSNQITKEHYRTMLQVFEFNRAPFKDYKVFLQEYEKYNGSSKEIYSQLLAVVGASGDVKQTTEILAEMRSMQVALTEHDFNSLLLAHARVKDMDGFQTVRDSMLATGISLTTETQTTFVIAHMENDDEIKASQILQQYHGQFDSDEVLRMLQSATASEVSQEFTSQLVKEFKVDYVRGPEVPISLRRICVELLHNDKLQYALTIINTLPKPNFQENQDIDTYGVFLLHALFKANCDLSKIIEIAVGLEDTNKNSRALHVAAEIALKRNPPLALPIFEALSKREQPLRPHYFWPLMMYNFRRHNEAGILRTLKSMQDFKVECDHLTITQYVLPRLSITLTNPQVTLKQFEEVGIKTSLVLTPIISHMLTQNKWFDVTPLVEAFTTKVNSSDLIAPLCSVAVHVRATKRYHQFAKLLNALSNKNIDRKQDFVGQFLIELISTQTRMRGDPNSLQRLVREMKKIGLSVSPAAVITLQTLLTQKNKDSPIEDYHNVVIKLNEMTNRNLILANSTEDESLMSSSFIKHPRDMSIDELECHLVELDSKQMNTRGVLRRLLQVCVRENRLQRALEIKQKCDNLKVQTSPGMLASIFEMYTKLEDLTNAEQTLQTLQKSYPGFQVDEHKFVDYAALLVKCGQLENAKKILEERKTKHHIIGGDYILKNVWNLLTKVAQLAAISEDLPIERNLTREMYAFLQKLGYCRTHNAILGPIVRERLLRGDLIAAIKEFKQLAQQYKHTPLQFELLSLIVRLCNGDEELSKKYNCEPQQAQQLLTDITEIVTKIHGAVNMNSGLLLAFAESGSDNQLRRLLINPEFRINEEILLRNCEHLGQEGAVQTLLRLARGARGLNRVINEQNIYNMLLDNFIKTNNYEAALNLYDRLNTDDELKISQEFLRNIVKLLKANNIEIPSNIALRAHIV